MWYNIVMGDFSTGRSVFRAVNLEFVEQVVRAYLTGKGHIIIDGIDYSISSSKFQVYSIEGNFTKEQAEKKYWDLFESIHREDDEIVKRMGDNITPQFLKGRAWGDLREMYYNLYVDDGTAKFFEILTKNEIENFLNEYAKGERNVNIGGKQVSLGIPKQVKIYDINIYFLDKYRGEIARKIKSFIQTNGGKLGLSTVEKIGKEVTWDFAPKPFGSEISKISLPDSAQDVGSETLKKTKIFISHSSKDIHYIRPFVDNILINAFEIRAAQIFCTSIEGMDIHSGKDFRNEIKKELQNAKMVIQILSEDYKKSEVCLNEMGAAWVLAEYVVPFVIQKKYDVGFIHSTTQQLVLTNDGDIWKFYEEYKDILGIHSSSTRINAQIKAFHSAIDIYLPKVAGPI